MVNRQNIKYKARMTNFTRNITELKNHIFKKQPKFLRSSLRWITEQDQKDHESVGSKNMKEIQLNYWSEQTKFFIYF